MLPSGNIRTPAPGVTMADNLEPVLNLLDEEEFEALLRDRIATATALRDRFLLALPAFEAAELPHNDPLALVGLIALPRPDGTVQYPAFQFDAQRRPWPKLLDINSRLGAVDDPWGVTEWWATADPMLGDRLPHLLLGAGPDADAALDLAAATTLDTWGLAH